MFIGLSTAISAALGTPFEPRSLFTDGSIGVLYDNNDLTTFFADSAGTAAAVVNGPVGLQLDKSQGLVLGANQIVNGSFSTDTSSWVNQFTGTTTWVSGRLRTTSSVTNSGEASQAITCVVGRAYRVACKVFGGTSNGRVSVSSSAFGAGVSTGTGFVSSFDGSFIFIAAATTQYIVLGNQTASAGVYAEFDDIVVQELPGNHRYQSTATSRPTLRGTPTGGNTVNNPDFDSATGWTLGTNWTISGGVATSTGANQFQALTRGDWAGVAGRWYRLTINVSAYTSGSLIIRAGSGTNKGTIDKGGVSELYFQADGAGLSLLSNATGFEFIGSITSIDVRDVSASSVTAPYGLQYDGVDDFMQTASVNFSATDKMFVCAGVRKLSDAAIAMLVELSTNSDTTNGAFHISAPSSAGTDRYRLLTRGTSNSGATASGFAAPNTHVVSGITEIATDTNIMRVNGAQVVSSSVDQGTGNYSNNIIYFGRRGGTSSPFNGLDFGFCIVGKTLTASQIASVERWMAQRTGVTL